MRNGLNTIKYIEVIIFMSTSASKTPKDSLK